MTASPAPSNDSITIRTHQTTYQPKKKKQKRVVDSDDERKFDWRISLITATASPPQASTSGLKLKLLPSKPSPAPSGHLDFTLPPQPNRPLVPPRPGVQKPPKPGPKRQAEVDIDFSNVKVSNQIAATAFQSSIDPYLRDLREDDLAMLGFKVGWT
jgi:transcriptional adapter 3